MIPPSTIMVNGQIFRGCWPLGLVMLVMLGLLLAVPQLSLWLPSLMR